MAAKTTTKRSEIPMNHPYIKIDLGNENIYIYDIEYKAYAEVTLYEEAMVSKRFMLR